MPKPLHSGYRQIVVEHPPVTHVVGDENCWMLDPIPLDISSNDIVPSWHVRPGRASGLQIDMRFRRQADGEWSPWMPVGEWGERTSTAPETRGVNWARIEIDHLKFYHAVDAAQVRVLATPGYATPFVDRLAFSLVDSGRDEREPIPIPTLNLDVPMRSQRSVSAGLAERVCSPTCVAMLLEHHGIRATIEDVAATCYDTRHDIFGNWNRAIQAAFQLGLRGYVQRFAGWAGPIEHLRAGRPLVASIAFGEDELPSAPIRKTNGHLVVIRGVEPHCVIVNDPAAPPGSGPLRYAIEPFSRAWFGHGGVCYVLGPAV